MQILADSYFQEIIKKYKYKLQTSTSTNTVQQTEEYMSSTAQ